MEPKWGPRAMQRVFTIERLAGDKNPIHGLCWRSMVGGFAHNVKVVGLERLPQERHCRHEATRRISEIEKRGLRRLHEPLWRIIALENNNRLFMAAMPDLTKCIERIDQMIDRKSTRLNSSHLGISYAVF